MGIDIRAFGERRLQGGVWGHTGHHPFDWTHSDLVIYGFLANIWNRESVPYISEPRGLPIDLSIGVLAALHSRKMVLIEAEHYDGCFGKSWLSVDELYRYDYTIIPKYHGGKTLREVLGDDFFEHLADLKKDCVERIVFWFHA